MLLKLGDLAGARAAYERALMISKVAYGPDHPDVATAVNNLGRVLQELGDHAGARAAYERALATISHFLPKDHPDVQIVQSNLDALED